PDVEGEQVARGGQRHPGELEGYGRVHPARRDFDVFTRALRILHHVGLVLAEVAQQPEGAVRGDLPGDPRHAPVRDDQAVGPAGPAEADAFPRTESDLSGPGAARRRHDDDAVHGVVPPSPISRGQLSPVQTGGSAEAGRGERRLRRPSVGSGEGAVTVAPTARSCSLRSDGRGSRASPTEGRTPGTRGEPGFCAAGQRPCIPGPLKPRLSVLEPGVVRSSGRSRRAETGAPDGGDSGSSGGTTCCAFTSPTWIWPGPGSPRLLTRSSRSPRVCTGSSPKRAGRPTPGGTAPHGSSCGRAVWSGPCVTSCCPCVRGPPTSRTSSP